VLLLWVRDELDVRALAELNEGGSEVCEGTTLDSVPYLSGIRALQFRNPVGSSRQGHDDTHSDRSSH
jgi:hypothetical protein